MKNIEGNKEKNIQYEWINLDEIDNSPIRPAEIKTILKKRTFPIHTINNDIGNINSLANKFELEHKVYYNDVEWKEIIE